MSNVIDIRSKAPAISYELLDRNVYGYKYRLTRTYEHKLLRPEWGNLGRTVRCTNWCELRPADGLLVLFEGYPWDGCSGPTIDRPANQRGGGVHDGLYALLRAGLLSVGARRTADLEFRDILIQDGFDLAIPYYWAVRMFGASSAALGTPVHKDVRRVG